MAVVRLTGGFGGLSGRVGNIVYVQTKSGTVMRDRPFASRQRSAAQQQIGRNLSRANAAWRALTDAERDAWQLYCLSLEETHPATGVPITPQASHVFLGYASKILQMNPEAVVPTSPPSTPFYGDSLHCAVAGGTGKMTVQASAPNAPGVTTEVLVQRLPGTHNRPQAKSYKTATFHTFAPGGMEIDVPLTPGAYAVAIRFVDVASGRMTAVYSVGKIVVER